MQKRKAAAAMWQTKNSVFCPTFPASDLLYYMKHSTEDQNNQFYNFIL